MTTAHEQHTSSRRSTTTEQGLSSVLTEDANVVRLRGRVGADAVERELPSGDRIVTWRVIVEQPAGRGRSAGRHRVDTIDCVAWSARLRRRAATLSASDQVQLSGALRRRFWQTPTGPASRYEVEVSDLRRLRG